MPFAQDSLGCDRVDADAVLKSLDGGDIRLGCRIKVDLNLVVSRHMTRNAFVLNARRQLGSLMTVIHRMTTQARLNGVTFVTGCRMGWLMRIMAGDTGHRIALLKTPALSQVSDLIRDMIFFRIAAFDGPVTLIQRLAWSIRKCRPLMFNRIAVALSTHVNQQFTREMARMQNRLGLSLFRVRLVEVDMRRGRSVTAFTSDSENRVISLETIHRPRDVLEPCCVAFQTTN